MEHILPIFWLFLKINLLSTSGPASVGLLHSEAVPLLITQDQFVQAVGFSTLLPGSDALQLAMYVGFLLGGVAGATAAILGAILPPTILLLAVVSVLHRLRREAWLSRFIQGLTPAVAVLLLFVAWKIFRGSGGEIGLPTAGIALGSLVALFFDLPGPLVLLIAGILGIFLLR